MGAGWSHGVRATAESDGFAESWTYSRTGRVLEYSQGGAVLGFEYDRDGRMGARTRGACERIDSTLDHAEAVPRTALSS